MGTQSRSNLQLTLGMPTSGWITGEFLRVSGGMESVSAAPGRRDQYMN